MRIDQDTREGGEVAQLDDETELADSEAAAVNLPPVGTHENADVPDQSEYVDLGEMVHSDDD